MSFVYASIAQQKKMLKSLGSWLDKAVEYAKTKSFEPDTLLSARLAPDQYALVRQIQSSCDNAKFAAARLSGKEAPKHPDTEQRMEELQARVRSCVSYLDTFKASDFDGAESRLVTLPFLEGKVILGSDYLVEMALPNFYFHVTHSYAILRHNGVPLGKSDYIGSLNVRDR